MYQENIRITVIVENATVIEIGKDAHSEPGNTVELARRTNLLSVIRSVLIFTSHVAYKYLMEPILRHFNT